MNEEMGGFGPPGVTPEAVNAYQLQTTGNVGPIPSATPYADSGTANSATYKIQFCDHSPTPSISSAGTTAGSGIVWAIEENQNNDNLPGQYGNYHDCAIPNGNGNGTGGHPNKYNPAALHAFCAAAGGTACPSAMTELYNSRRLSTHLGQGDSFPVPTIFNGYVYIGTDPNVASGGSGSDGEIDVFGICPKTGCLP